MNKGDVSMKSTCIIKKVDEFGRIVIPVELRRELDFDTKDSIEFFRDGNHIILRKYTLGCSHCGMVGTVFELDNIRLCEACRDFCTGFAVGYVIGEPKAIGSSLLPKNKGWEWNTK
jgi:transcriptional pleiotropic regulator of transition state genes